MSLYVPRAIQIETIELDQQFVHAVVAGLSRLNIGLIDDYRLELRTILETYLWFRKVWLAERTVGLEAQRLRFYDARTLADGLSRLQKISFMIPIALNYLQERLAFNERFSKPIDIATNVGRALSLLNYLVFIYFGDYRTLSERLFRIKVGKENMFANSPQPNSTSYLNREILWELIASIITLTIPIASHFIDFDTLIDYFTSSGKVATKAMEDYDCRLCGRPATNARLMAGCVHLYCYRCIMGKLTSRGFYSCDICQVKIDSPSKLCDRRF